MPRAVAYSATSMGYVSFISLNFFLDIDLTFHWTQSIHPLVVRFMCFSSLQHEVHIFLLNCIVSHLVIYNASMRQNCLPSTSHCVYMHSAMRFAPNSTCPPSVNSIKDRVRVGNDNGISFIVLLTHDLTIPDTISSPLDRVTAAPM